MTFISGTIHLSKSEVLRPGLTEPDFRIGAEGSKAEIFVSNPPYTSYKLGLRIIEGKEFNVVAFFEKGILRRISMSRPTNAGDTWANYDPQIENAWTNGTKIWVELVLNNSLPMQFTWGTLDCNFDPRSGSGSLVLAYDATL